MSINDPFYLPENDSTNLPKPSNSRKKKSNKAPNTKPLTTTLPPPTPPSKSTDTSKMKKSWGKLNRKQWHGKHFVVLLGQFAAAKSTLLTAVSMYAKETYPVLTKPRDNPKGAAYMKRSIANLKAGKFPMANNIDELYIYESEIGFANNDMTVNFIETSGEAFVGFEPKLHDEPNQLTTHQELSLKELENFLQKYPDVLILLTVAYDEAEKFDDYYHTVLARLAQLNLNLLENIGLVITKWDYNRNSRGKQAFPNAQAFAKVRMPFTYRMLRGKYIKRSKFFHFSIGKVRVKKGEEVGSLHGNLNLNDCGPILRWIKYCFVTQPNRQLADEERTQIEQLEKLSEGLKQVKQDIQQVEIQHQQNNKQPGANKSRWKAFLQKIF